MKYRLGIDIGGTNLRAALLNDEMKLVDKIKISNEVELGPEKALGKLVAKIKEAWNLDEITAIGIGAPGPLDLKKGCILEAPNLKGWNYFNLKEFFEKELNKKVTLNNDANVAGLSEATVGAGKDAESVYYITLSTGVGGGFIYKGEIVNGFNSIAGEIGNMIINEDKYCHSNMNEGGLEGQCSGGNIARIVEEKTEESLSTKEVFERAESGDERYKDTINEWAINVAKAIANIVVTVDPEVIVLGGSVIINNTKYLEDIKREVSKRVFEGIEVNIKLAKIGDDTGLIGAGILATMKK